jgi:hypothetical protein
MIGSLIRRQQKRGWHPYSLLLFCVFTGGTRGILEFVLHGINISNADMLNFIPFYVLLAMLLTLMLSKIADVQFQTVQKSLLMGIFLGLFPPILDVLMPHDYPVLYGYYFVWDFANLPYLGYNPMLSFPAGEAITIWLSVFFCGLYVFVLTANYLRTLLALVVGYCVFIFMGSLFPMIITKLSTSGVDSLAQLRELSPLTINAIGFRLSFYQGLLALFIYLLVRPGLCLQICKRLIHIVPFIMLTLLGGIMVQANSVSLLQSALLMLAVGIALIVQNDFFDAAEDSESRPPQIAEFDVKTVNFLVVLCMLGIFFHNNRAAVSALIAFICGVLYNYPFYRARNTFPSNLKIEGVWALTSFLSGAMLETSRTNSPRVQLVAFLVFGGWSLAALVKDLKDIDADKKNHVRTVFTLLENRGIRRERAWFYIRIVIVLLVSAPVLLAAIFGSGIAAALAVVGALLPATALFGANGKAGFRLFLMAVSLDIICWQFIFAKSWV